MPFPESTDEQHCSDRQRQRADDDRCQVTIA
jgi:hypothetical protein